MVLILFLKIFDALVKKERRGGGAKKFIFELFEFIFLRFELFDFSFGIFQNNLLFILKF